MPRGSKWTNSDGLVVGFGTRTADYNTGSAVRSDSVVQQVVVKIKASDLLDADVSDQLVNGVTIPADSLLTRADLFVTTAFASAGSAVLDIGIYNASSGAAIDDDGIDAAIAVAALVDSADFACDGALVGTVLANNSKVGVSYDTAAFTAGEATLVVEYIPKM